MRGNMTKRHWNILFTILFLGSALAAVKLIFFDYTMDEEYQLMMGYRILRGDRLFREMWEPHQTSAFLCAGLMWIYKTLTGTYTGILLFLRLCTTFIQIALGRYLYRILSKLLDRNYALLCALIYFNSVPKNIQIPDFSNMQLWFFTLTVLLLMQYYLPAEPERKKKGFLVFIAGICMALEVLSYPSCIILFPFFLICIYRYSKQTRWRDIGLFCGACAVSAGIWLFMVLHHVKADELLRNVKYLLDFDLTHEISGATAGKLQGILSNLWGGFGFILLTCALSLPALAMIRVRNRNMEKRQYFLIFLIMLVFISVCIQEYLWIFKKSGYEVWQLHLLLLLFSGLLACPFAGKKRNYFIMGIIGTLLSLLAVIYISDLEMFYALPHGILGGAFCAVILVLALENTLQKSAGRWICFLLVSLCVVSITGKGYTLRAGRDYNVITDTKSIMRHGPAAGILSDYMNCYIYNCNFEDFNTYVNPDDVVLIVTNMVMSAGTTPYMIAGAEVAHYSIVDPTAYDERLLTYWALYPEKQPNVIVTDCWYGQLMEDQNSWIMQYIENEFGYRQVNDGRYVRFYRK